MTLRTLLLQWRAVPLCETRRHIRRFFFFSARVFAPTWHKKKTIHISSLITGQMALGVRKSGALLCYLSICCLQGHVHVILALKPLGTCPIEHFLACSTVLLDHLRGKRLGLRNVYSTCATQVIKKSDLDQARS